MAKKEDKLKALELTLGKLEKSYGKGVVMKLGDKVQENVSSIPSGSIGLDAALGVGGYPKGRVIEIYGPESSGKTTLTIHAIAEVQKQGGIAAFIDAEHAFDAIYASNLGVKIQKPKKLTNLNEYFFGEDQSRYLLEISADHLTRVEKNLKKNNIFYELIGKTQKKYFEIENEMKLDVNYLSKINNQWYF